ncbi:hypothetical protein RU639_007508 [Aspergillus parasiticus]
MPLIYGEGERAFVRLQEEIIEFSNDQSILAWGYLEPWKSHEDNQSELYAPVQVKEKRMGVLARSPAAFRGCGSIIPSLVDKGTIAPHARYGHEHIPTEPQDDFSRTIALHGKHSFTFYVRAKEMQCCTVFQSHQATSYGGFPLDDEKRNVLDERALPSHKFRSPSSFISSIYMEEYLELHLVRCGPCVQTGIYSASDSFRFCDETRDSMAEGPSESIVCGRYLVPGVHDAS